MIKKEPISTNKKIKSTIKFENQLYKIYMKNGINETDFFNTGNPVTEINELTFQPLKHPTMKNLEKS